MVLLDVAVDFRNAIVHGNETQVARVAASGQISATLTSYRRYRRAIAQLPSTTDRATATRLATLRSRHPGETDAQDRTVTRIRRGSRRLDWWRRRAWRSPRALYGPPRHRHVVIMLTPEVSEVVDEPTTVSLPLEGVRRVSPAA